MQYICTTYKQNKQNSILPWCWALFAEFDSSIQEPKPDIMNSYIPSFEENFMNFV